MPMCHANSLYFAYVFAACGAGSCVYDRKSFEPVVIDSFTMSGWMSQWFHARFAGQILDAGPLAPVGHGVGMAIGAQLARPGKQVLLIIGDGGLGISGFYLVRAAMGCRSSRFCGTTVPGGQALTKCHS
jgi:hypothetical protein